MTKLVAKDLMQTLTMTAAINIMAVIGCVMGLIGISYIAKFLDKKS